MPKRAQDVHDGPPPVRHLWTPVGLFWSFWAIALLLPLDLLTGFTPLQAGLTVAAAAVVSNVCAWLLMKLIDALTPVRVCQEGLNTYNGFGVPTFVRWDAVRRAGRLVLWPGPEWLMVDDGRPWLVRACLPLFVKDRDSLYRAVTAFAGAEHPLSTALRKRGFGA